jgi:hypothetical protein
MGVGLKAGSPSCVTIKNPNLLTSSETGIHARMRNYNKKKTTYLNWLDVRQPFVACVLQVSEVFRLLNLVLTYGVITPKAAYQRRRSKQTDDPKKKKKN